MKETQKNGDKREYCDREFSATPIRRGVKCGIDNPAFSCDDIGQEEGKGAWPVDEGAWPEEAGSQPEGAGLRLCYLERSRRGQRLGFSIERDALGVLVSHVTAGGLADGAGLRVGDVILHVNGWPLPHDVTIDHAWAKIKASHTAGAGAGRGGRGGGGSGGSGVGGGGVGGGGVGGGGVALTVSDRAWARVSAGRALAEPRGDPGGVPSPWGGAPAAGGVPRGLLRGLPRAPRVAKLQRHPIRGYGFYLREIRGVAGQFIHDVECKSEAERAGLRDGDRLVAVNGSSVERMEHAQVVDFIRARGSRVDLLLVDSPTDAMCSRIGISPMAFLPWLGQ